MSDDDNSIEKGLVSVIMPTYNSEKYVEDAIQSIRSQSYENWELLVSDDRSTDSTITILHKLANLDARIKIYPMTINSGAAVTRNNSISLASGEYIAFLDSDDIWKPEKLEKQLDFMINNDASFSYTAFEIMRENGNSDTPKLMDLDSVSSVSYDDMLKKRSTMGCLTVMFRPADYSSYSMPLIRQGQDYALWLKLLKTGTDAKKLNVVLSEYRIVPESLSRNKIRKAFRQFQIYRQHEKLSLAYSCLCFVHYAIRAVAPPNIANKLLG